MKKIGELMKELGFRPEGSDEVKRAFIENLLAGLAPEARAQVLKTQPRLAKTAKPPEQMSLFETEPLKPQSSKPKVG